MRMSSSVPRLSAFVALLVLSAHLVLAASSQQKVEKLNDLYKPGEIFELETTSFLRFSEKPRNYSLVVVLTALSSEHQCEPCRDFRKEEKLVASALASTFTPGHVYFTSLDFKNGRDIFVTLKLTNVPYILHFPPTEGPNAKSIPDEYEVYDIPMGGLLAESVAKWISNVAKIEPPVTIKRPIDYTKYAPLAGSVVILLASLYIAGPAIVLIFQSKHIWTAIAMAWILTFTSGYMWNQIRGAPYQGRQRNGQPEMISPSYQNQYQVETQMVGTFYGLISLLFVGLAVKFPGSSNLNIQRISSVILLIAFLGAFSLLVKVYNFKHGGQYPFGLFF
ncbi:uncharacterized protein BJ171DRAFT_484611 [Polychytrium aggregatum]|uniref:uncharacterized protein n=1 Tax=Polychytrium aggregatum TaxID=110093 RepID=UPI0022FE9A28|nr:uncharacterized protein BJ171DRAFT_484611 [Polychytrium aggregatum]KAI9209637.1 hypothetical protein BJ171DRAFT_484611 [Polychytrium aggregatum]